MKAWLLAGGFRWRQVTTFISPWRRRRGEPAAEVPALIAVRFHGEPAGPGDLATDLSLELAGGAVWPLRACEVQAAPEQDEWELVAELVSPAG